MSDVATSENGQRQRKVTAFYIALVAALDRRRRSLGWTFEHCDDRSGNADRYTAKGFHPNAPSGRQMTWVVLQNLVDALFPAGVEIILKPRPVSDPKLLARLRKQEPLVPKGGASHQRYREFLEVCRRGGLASHAVRMARHTPEQRARFARKAARARAAKLTPAERSVIAREGGLARWRRVRADAADG